MLVLGLSKIKSSRALGCVRALAEGSRTPAQPLSHNYEGWAHMSPGGSGRTQTPQAGSVCIRIRAHRRLRFYTKIRNF